MGDNADGNGMPAGMAEMFMRFMELQNQAAARAQRRVIPPIDKIHKQEEFPVWNDKLITALYHEDLDKYILTDVPEPEDDVAKAQWRTDRADVDRYIQMHVPGNKVWSVIRGMGWKARDVDPKRTYDFVTRFFEKGAMDANVLMAQELANIHRSSFDKMEAFQSRVNYLRDRLNATRFKMHDEAFMWFVLKGIVKEYPDMYNRMSLSLHNDTLTWDDLMAELQQLAVTEDAQPAMTSVKFEKAKSNNNNNNTKDDESAAEGKKKKYTREKEDCKVCNKSVWKALTHCHSCGGHHLGTDCWWCNPEKASDSWKHKEEATAKKAAKSTTGPLHQQSGIANAPGGQRVSNAAPSNLLFTTNHTNDYDVNMMNIQPDIQPDFHQGPWRK